MGPHTDTILSFSCNRCVRVFAGMRVPISMAFGEQLKRVNELIAIADDRDRLLDDARD